MNERVPLTIKLLVNDLPIRDIQYPQFASQGFLLDDFEKPQQSSGVFNGVRYDTVEFKTNIYPDRLGNYPWDPSRSKAMSFISPVKANLLTRTMIFLGRMS